MGCEAAFGVVRPTQRAHIVHIVLLAAQGLHNKDIAAQPGIGRVQDVPLRPGRTARHGPAG